MKRAAPSLPSHANEVELVQRLAAGDLDALGSLFDTYAQDIRRFVLRMGIEATDADDLVQNAFLGAFRSAARFDAEYAVRTWLFGIAAMHIRRHRRSVARLAARFASWAKEPPLVAEGPDGAAAARQEIARLQAALDALAQKKREAFVMVVLEGVPGEEAARVLGVPLNTIWTRLHHARRELRSALERGGVEEGGES